ncbi:hypothetical protein QJS10_CPB11g01695 [Acorus calamus]|uniref:DUF4283 domain-containing protein n=1 Tax=Acorus calamus TaxID=4465 RepID=A0AAV9DVQ1_ACOCL|nr:hypothetical protein QJS10_CPB11g01695 [Acorus calamus]
MRPGATVESLAKAFATACWTNDSAFGQGRSKRRRALEAMVKSFNTEQAEKAIDPALPSLANSQAATNYVTLDSAKGPAPSSHEDSVRDSAPSFLTTTNKVLGSPLKVIGSPSQSASHKGKGILPTPAPRGESHKPVQKEAAPRSHNQRLNLPPPAVNEEAKLWSSFFSTPAGKNPNLSVNFYPPSIDGPQKVAILEEDEVAEAEAAWGRILVGYVWGKSPVFTPFLQFIKNLWKPKGEIHLSFQGNGFFMVRFDLEEDLIHVLEGGPWSMANRPFVIQRWNRNIRFELERLKSIPLWIKLPNLPLHFWSRTCLGRIASLIGTPLYLDSPTALKSRTAYARVCVEVDAGFELPDKVFVEVRNGDREAIKITYDWKPQACTHCQTFGHDDSLCCKKPRVIVASSKVSEGDTHVTHVAGHLSSDR